jgi:hypothetical protein
MSMKRGLIAFAVLLTVAGFIPGVTLTSASIDSATRRCQPAGTSGHPYYASTSPLNMKIPDDPQIDPASSGMVAGLTEAGADHRFILAVKSYAIPIYSANSRTPTRNVSMTAEWASRPFLKNVPIPANARPDPSSDGHLAIVDRVGGCEYDFWQARRGANGGWAAGWANVIPLGGRGVFPKGNGARGSGFALLAGLIFPQELKSGHINHALAMSYPMTRAGGPRRPASSSDGTSKGPGAIPEGAHLQLDPTLELSTLSLPRYELVIARALQIYGAYIVDTGGVISLFAVNPQSYKRNPYAGKLPNLDSVSLDGIPLDRFRVLAPRAR